MKFTVKRYWELCDEVDVEAESADQAIAVAHGMPLDNTKAQYVPDSLDTDPDTDVQQLDRGGL